VIILDGITRLARLQPGRPATGRIMFRWRGLRSALSPKKFFGARATSKRRLVNNHRLGAGRKGSKMDEVIFEEFKGTGNMELRLTASGGTTYLPGIDVNASSSATKSCSSAARHYPRSGSCAACSTVSPQKVVKRRAGTLNRQAE